MSIFDDPADWGEAPARNLRGMAHAAFDVAERAAPFVLIPLAVIMDMLVVIGFAFAAKHYVDHFIRHNAAWLLFWTVMIIATWGPTIAVARHRAKKSSTP